MRIAIVDDDGLDRRWLAERLEDLLARRKLDGTVFPFDSGESFLAAARREKFDLAFLDIYMKGLDGVSAAKELRSFDPDCLLVFSTTSPDHALEGYRVQAFQYLVKPWGMEDLERLFDQLVRLLPAAEKYVELKTGRQSVRLRLRDIRWAEHFQHQIRVHAAEGRELSTRLTFSAFSGMLAEDPRFFICGRGLLVNLDHAADFDGSVFLLDDGVRLPVTRELLPSARAAFGDRLFQTERRRQDV